MSSGTNKANSFKSVTSYVLGDLDIAKSAQDGSDSFDISSNTSVVKSEEAKQEFIDIGNLLPAMYARLAKLAFDRNERLWKVSPKLHMFMHLLMHP